jgi:pimeloyl-ACP methyl ester carboxylesterase
MADRRNTRTSDVRGAAKLAIDAVLRTTDLVESMHHNISSVPWPLGPALPGRTSGITGFVYSCIRTITQVVGVTIEASLAPFEALLQDTGEPSSLERDAVVAAVNGVVGDHLVDTHNPLAIQMQLRHAGKRIELSAEALGQQFGTAPNKLVIVVHGLCMSDLQWARKGHDHGAALARDLGYTPLYLYYNSGRHISVNGREFADLLEQLLQVWPGPVEELAIVAHSMGGLVARSACYYAQLEQHSWLARLDRLACLGTPHHGAPLERHGQRVHTLFAGISPYVAPLSRLAALRSAGVTDLRHGNLVDADWQGADRFEAHQDRRTHVPLPAHVRCYAIAATLGAQRGDNNDRLLGDGLVPVPSALGEHQDPARALSFPVDQQSVVFGTNHWDLLSDPTVYNQLVTWWKPEAKSHSAA